MVEEPPPCGSSVPFTRKPPMRIPSSGGVLRVGVQAFVTQDGVGGLGQLISTAWRAFFSNHVASQSPMTNRSDHVLANAERRDCVVVSKSRFKDDSPRFRTIKYLFEPHLTQRKCLVSGEVHRHAF